MGAPRPSERIEGFIREIYTDLKILSRYEPSGKQILSSLQNRMKREGIPLSELPSIRTIHNRLKDFRTRIDNNHSISLIDESKPWDTLSLNIFPLPTDSIPFIMQQWRYSIALDIVLTIRQAKWISRLYYFFKDKDISELWFASQRYSREEELSILKEAPAKIFHLDSRLVMGDWEWWTSYYTDLYESRDYVQGFVHHTTIPMGYDGGIQEEFIHSLPSLDDLINTTNENEYKRNMEIRHLVSVLPSSSEFFPDLETRLVYLRHLSYLAKMPKWKSIKPDITRDIIVHLRQIILNFKKDIDDNRIKIKNGEKTEVPVMYSEDELYSGLQWKYHEDFKNMYENLGHEIGGILK
jgi:hypothetical protein